MDPGLDRTSYEFFGFVLVEYVEFVETRVDRPVTVLSYAVIKSTYGETRVLCLSLVPSKVIAFFYGLSRELRDISVLDVSILSRSAFWTFWTPLIHRGRIFRAWDKLQGNDLKIVCSMIDSERRLFGTNFEENFRNADADNVLRAIYKLLDYAVIKTFKRTRVRKKLGLAFRQKRRKKYPQSVN